MKNCTKCGILKDEEEFHFKNRKKNKRIAWCRSCWSEYSKQHYQDNKRMYLDKTKRWNSLRLDHFSRFLLGYLSKHPCVDCGESNPIVLTFDHVRGKKEFNLSQGGAHSQESVLKEIDKCDIRCANCHLKVTAQRGKFRKLKFASLM